MRMVTATTVILLLVYLTAGAAIAAMKNDSATHQSPDSYSAVWEWCGNRFPYREDLQEACRRGAYEMVPANEGAKDA